MGNASASLRVKTDAPASTSNASQYASSAQENKEVYSNSAHARCGVFRRTGCTSANVFNGKSNKENFHCVTVYINYEIKSDNSFQWCESSQMFPLGRVNAVPAETYEKRFVQKPPHNYRYISSFHMFFTYL